MPEPARLEVDFHDIEDPSAFVHATINRAKILMSVDEREDLHAEGMAILCKLARDYRPHMPGYAVAGRFSGYAAVFLARKLGDAWHRMHPDHVLVTDPETGKRRWRYLEKPVSLDALMGDDPDRHSLLADDAGAGDIAGWLQRALWEEADRMIDMTIRVAKLRGQRLPDGEIAQRLGLSLAQIQERNHHLNAITDRLRDGVPLRDALRGRAAGQIAVAVLVGEMMSQDHRTTVTDVAETLELDPGIVRDSMLLIARVRSRLETFANGKEAA